MKTKFRFQENIFCIFLITFHARFGHCRPSASYVDTQNRLQSPQSQVRPAYDLINMNGTGVLVAHGEPADDVLHMYSGKDFTDYLSDDVGLIGSIKVGKDAPDDDTESTRNDVTYRVVAGKEGPTPRHQEVPFTNRNLVRKRRHPDPHRPHRRRRRKHRLMMKAKDRNHLSNGDIDLKDRRDRFLIKSDSPSYVITSASEVKKDWCKTIPFRQKISEFNCRSRVVQNNFCYGQCNSFFIPHSSRTDNKVNFQSCAFCKPSRQHWGNVTLNCPGRNPPKVAKTVLFVDVCKCITEILQ